jgi:hypothetical protein
MRTLPLSRRIAVKTDEASVLASRLYIRRVKLRETLNKALFQPFNRYFMTHKAKNLGSFGFVFFEKPNKDAGFLGSFGKNGIGVTSRLVKIH